MSLRVVTASGEAHGLINTVANSVPDNGFKRFSENFRPEMEKNKKRDAEIVKARYLNSRKGREVLERPYMKYEGQPIQHWKFIHNHVYEIPRGLVDEVNGQPELPMRSEIVDASGAPTTRDGPGEKLHQFVPVDF
jgi:hypothetical protein